MNSQIQPLTPDFLGLGARSIDFYLEGKYPSTYFRSNEDYQEYLDLAEFLRSPSTITDEEFVQILKDFDEAFPPTEYSWTITEAEQIAFGKKYLHQN